MAPYSKWRPIQNGVLFKMASYSKWRPIQNGVLYLQPLHLAEEKEAEHLGLLGAWLGLSLTLGTVGKRTEKKKLTFCAERSI
jgi:hypothetical protein